MKKSLLIGIGVAIAVFTISLLLTRNQWAASTMVGVVDFPLRTSLVGNQSGWREFTGAPAGSRISIGNVTGTVCFHIGDCEGTSVGPDGYAATCYDAECASQPYNPGFSHGAALGYIGRTPPIVGDPEIFLLTDGVSRSGYSGAKFYIAINDGNTTDNDGTFRFEMRKQ